MNARVRFKLNTCQRPDHLPLIGWLAHPQLRPRGRTLFHCQPIRLLSQLVNDRIMRHLQVERRPFWYACSSWAAASRASVSRSAARALASPRRCWKLKTTSAAHGSDVAIQVPLRCRRPGLFPLFRQSAATGMRLDRALWKPGETLRCVTPSPRHPVTTSPRHHVTENVNRAACKPPFAAGDSWNCRANTPWQATRLRARVGDTGLRRIIEDVVQKGVPGPFAELSCVPSGS